MITITASVKCDAWLSQELAPDGAPVGAPVTCGILGLVTFEYVGRQGQVPLFNCSNLPEGWYVEEQSDGEIRHFCPKHKDGDEPLVRE